MRLKGKVALVTGAGSGNGAAIAVEYLNQGAFVVFADIDEESARNTAINSGFSNENWLVHRTDVANRNSIKKCISATINKFGHLDVLVANAGITIRKPFLEQTDEDYDRIMNTNSKGVFLCSQEAARVMVIKGGGVIIHISSICSIRAPRSDIVSYGASKGAILAMTRHMALDLSKENIRVNAIAPGSIRTNMNQKRLSNPEEERREAERNLLGRIGTPKELTSVAVLLASDESSFITGTQIVIDGGETIQ